MDWFEADMEAGDCLFIPSKWYHQVESSSERNLAVNMWWWRQNRAQRVSPTCTPSGNGSETEGEGGAPPHRFVDCDFRIWDENDQVTYVNDSLNGYTPMNACTIRATGDLLFHSH